MTEETERIYVIPLKKKYAPSSRAAPTAVKRVKHYINRHMKVDEDDIWIDESLNNAIWSKGKYKMPSKIRVKAVRFEDGVVEVYLPELEFEKSRREILQEEREKKQPILRKEEVETEETDEAGTEDYEVVPTGDGDVKLKKKKHAKELDEDKDESLAEEDEDIEEKPSSETNELEESEDESETTEEIEETEESKKKKEAVEQADEEFEETSDETDESEEIKKEKEADESSDDESKDISEEKDETVEESKKNE